MDVGQGAERRVPCTATLYRFGSFSLCPATQELHRDGTLVAMAPQTFSLLTYLVRHHQRALSREELLHELWPDTVVGEGSLRLAIHDIRKTLGDTGSEQQFVRTVRGAGYRFIAPVTISAHVEPRGERRRPQVSGRASECALLESALVASETRGQVCLCLGVPGIGKSHLAQFASQRAEERGYAVAFGHAGRGDDVAPLEPWAQLLRTLLASASRSLQLRCRRTVPVAYGALLEGASLPTEWMSLPGSDGERRWLLEELARLIFMLADERPLGLFFEDLHAADEASLALFLHLAKSPVRARVWLFATARPVAAKQHRALARALAQLGQDPTTLRLELSGLTLAESHAMVAADVPRLDLRLLPEIHELSGGNPLFTLELARLLSHVGACSARDTLTGLAGELGSVVGRRFGTLPADCLRAIVTASVLGHEFGIAELAHLLRGSARDALARVEEACQHGFLTRDGSRYRARFAHALLRDHAYELLPSTERGDLHHRAAEWLEESDATSAQAVATLSHHYHQAAASGGARKAVTYAVRCAERALRAGTYAEAISHYERALSCIDLAGAAATDRLAIEIDRAEAVRLSGAGSASLNDHIAELAERAVRAGAPRLFVQAVLVYAGQTEAHFSPVRFLASTDRRELELIERALASIPHEPSRERALLLCALGYALIYTAENERRAAACHEAVAVARSVGLAWLSARALMIKSSVCADPRDLDSRLSASSELIELLQRHGFQELELEARLRRAVCLLEAGDRATAERDEVKATRLAQLMSSPRLRVRSELLALLRAFSAGELDRAETLAQRALELDPTDPTSRSLYLVRMASIQNLRHGPTPNLITMHEGLVEAYPDTIGFRCSLASVYAVAGRAAEAREQFDWVARDTFGALPSNFNWLAEMSLMADTAVSLDDAARASGVYRALLPYGDRWLIFAGEAAPGGPIAYWLCNLAATQRAFEEGKRWLARARRLAETMSAPLFERFSDLAEARLLLTCGESEHDAVRAYDLLSRVIEFASRHGLECLRLCAVDLETRYGSTRPCDQPVTENRPSH
jgi:DNA-binding winged helix-turn-helix (wHTH) protein/tetratricopeptide (TPR) repeat protein